MIIRCQQCNTAYNIPDAKIVSGETKVRCLKCQTVFIVGETVVREPEVVFVETATQDDSDFADEPSMVQSPMSEEDELDAFLAAESMGQDADQQASPSVEETTGSEDDLKVDDWLDKFDNMDFSLSDDGGGKPVAASLPLPSPIQVETKKTAQLVVESSGDDDLDDSAFKDLFEGDFGLDHDETQTGPEVQLKADASAQSDLGMMLEDFDTFDTPEPSEFDEQILKSDPDMKSNGELPGATVDSASERSLAVETFEADGEGELFNLGLDVDSALSEGILLTEQPSMPAETNQDLDDQLQNWTREVKEEASERQEEESPEPFQASEEAAVEDKPDSMTWESALLDELEISEDEIAELSQLASATDGKVHEVEVQTSEASDDDFFGPSTQGSISSDSAKTGLLQKTHQQTRIIPQRPREDEDTIVIDHSYADDGTVLEDGVHRAEESPSHQAQSAGPPGRRDGFVERESKKAAKERKKVKGREAAQKSRLSPLFLFALLILILCGAGYYFFPQFLGMSTEESITPSPPKPTPTVEETSTLQELAVNLKDVQQYVVKHRTLGALLVIEGFAKNDSKKTKESIQVEVSLLDGQSAVVLKKNVFCGLSLTQDQMQAMEQGQLESFFDKDSGGSYKVVPGDSLRFMVVFVAPPRTVEDFQVKVVGAKNAL